MTQNHLPSERIRNIGIMAHIDAGKTTTTERLLYYAGKIHQMGEVDDGSATMDWMSQEKERGITITSAVTSFYWDDKKINLVDTPGHVDFTTEVERCLRVLDGVVALYCAVGDVETQSETVWEQADKYNIPRIAYVNKMDRVGADFDRCVEMMRKKLDASAYPITIPHGEESDFDGIIDVIEEEFIDYSKMQIGEGFEKKEVPADYKDKCSKTRWNLLEKLSENDDEILECLVEEREVPIETIHKAIRKQVINHKIVPVTCGASLRNIGTLKLLNAISAYLPSPEDISQVEGRDPETNEILTRQLSDEDPFSGIVFKVTTDPFVDKLSYFRVYSGTLENKTQVLNPRTGEKERVSKIFAMHAHDRKQMDKVASGDIIALGGIDKIVTGDSLCDPEHPIMFQEMEFPESVVFCAVEPRSYKDEEIFDDVLKKLEVEDPAFHVKKDPDTGQTIISGMGELHLEILVERMKREFDLQVNVGKPQVAYKETVTATAKAEGLFDKPVEGTTQFAKAIMEVKPRERGMGSKFKTRLPNDGILPRHILNAIQEAVEIALETGPIAGYPLIDVKATLTDIEFKEDISTEMSFKAAAANAMKKALNNAEPRLLEPVMEVEITTPELYLGDVINELNKRNAQIDEISTRSEKKVIKCTVPLARMFGYSNILRSITQGKGLFMMSFKEYRRMPKKREEKLLDKVQGKFL